MSVLARLPMLVLNELPLEAFSVLQKVVNEMDTQDNIWLTTMGSV